MTARYCCCTMQTPRLKEMNSLCTELKCLSGIKWDLEQLSGVMRMDWGTALSASPLGFLLQTRQNWYEKQSGTPWDCLESTKFASGLNGGSHLQAISIIHVWSHGVYFNKQNYCITIVSQKWCALMKNTKESVFAGKPDKNHTFQFSLQYTGTVYCTQRTHQTVGGFPGAREEIPAFFRTVIPLCSAHPPTPKNPKNRCVYLYCATQVLLRGSWSD